MREKMSRIVVVAWAAALSRHEVLNGARDYGSCLPNENQHESTRRMNYIAREKHAGIHVLILSYRP